MIGIIGTEEYKRRYDSRRLKGEFKKSREYKYQLIIPEHKYARMELEYPIEVHDIQKGENRQGVVWRPNKGTKIYRRIRRARFKE